MNKDEKVTGGEHGQELSALDQHVRAVMALGDRLRLAEYVTWWERLIERTRLVERWEYSDGRRWRRYWRRHGRLPKRLRKAVPGG